MYVHVHKCTFCHYVMLVRTHIIIFKHGLLKIEKWSLFRTLLTLAPPISPHQTGLHPLHWQSQGGQDCHEMRCRKFDPLHPRTWRKEVKLCIYSTSIYIYICGCVYFVGLRNEGIKFYILCGMRY